MRIRHCKDPTHSRRLNDGRCSECLAVNNRNYHLRKRERAGEILLIRAGESLQSAGTRASWATRRAKYGPSGTSWVPNPKRLAELARASLKTYCKRGHLLSGANLYTQAGRPGKIHRKCRACIKLRQTAYRQRSKLTERPEWAVTLAGVRLCIATHDIWCLTESRQLWATVISSHPDNGGTNVKFKIARTRWNTFMKRQCEWYRVAGISLPSNMKRSAV